MHCYKSLIAATRVARIIDKLKNSEQHIHPAAIAVWMEASGLEIEDVVDADNETLQAQVAGLLDREKRMQISLAA